MKSNPLKAVLLCALAGVALVNTASAQVPSNDDCPGFGSFAVNGGGFIAFQADTENATDSTFDDLGACSNRPPNLKDVFFFLIATQTGYYRIYTGDSNTIGYDTVMTAYSGWGCDPTDCIGFNDDISGSNYGSELRLFLSAGDKIVIQVGAYSNSVNPVSTNRLSFQDLQVPGDTCATAIPISGYGDFDYSNEFHSISPFPLGGCQSTGEDVYYEWTAPASASGSDFIFRFQPDSGFDHEVFSYSSCTGVCLGVSHENGCNGSTHQLFVGINAGDKIIFKVAGYDPGDLGTGTLSVLDPSCDPCTQDDAYEENDTCDDAVELPSDYSTDFWLDPTDSDFYSVCVAAGASVDIGIFFDHAGGDIDARLFNADGFDCNAVVGELVLAQSSTDDEGVFWTNNTGMSVDLILHVYLYPGATTCATYDVLNISGDCGGTMTPFCSPATLNSTGNAAELTGVIDSFYPGSELHLEVTGGVPNEFGYFVVGTNAFEPGMPVGNGFLCFDTSAGNLVGRYNVNQTLMNSLGQFNSNGVFVNLSGTSSDGGFTGFDVPSNLPFPGNPTIMPGQTFHYQVWYRDTPAGSGQSNLSNGLSVLF